MLCEMKLSIASGVAASLILIAVAGAATPSTNPADLEITAFTNLKYPTAADPIGQNDINDVPLNAAVDGYFETHRADFDLIRQAAAQPAADWGDTTSDMSRVMTQLNASRNAVNLLWLKSRWDQNHGRPADAADDLLNSMAIARHVGQGRLLVCHLVEIGCEVGACNRMAAILPSLPATVVESLPAKLDTLPPSAGFAAMLDGESRFASAQGFRQFGGPYADPLQQATAPIAVMQTAQLARFYDAIKPAASKSPVDLSTAIDAALAKMPESMYVKVLAPSLKRAREPSAELEARVAMLRTAVAIALSGPAAVDDSVDPFGGGAPFIRKDSPNGGYALESHLLSRGKAVSLQIGQ
ncbi:MAG: hypothetical protein JWM57_1642 [Phycisphaerales bacterium]|nr:hypothetical protein [Phycisphaerales bacterium]